MPPSRSRRTSCRSRSRASSRSCCCASARSCPASSGPSRRSRARSGIAWPRSAPARRCRPCTRRSRTSARPARRCRRSASSLKLPFREIAETDRAGKTARRQAGHRACRGRQDRARPHSPAPSGIEAEATELGDGGYAWVDVLGRHAGEAEALRGGARPRSKTGYLELERRKEIAALAAKLVERLTGGETLRGARQGGRRQGREDRPPSRAAPSPQGLTQNAVQQAFALPKGGATSAPTADGKARIVLRVAEITPAPRADPGADRSPEDRADAPDAERRSGRVRCRPAGALRHHRQRGGPEAGAGHRGASSRIPSDGCAPRTGRDRKR